jgi:hypothetical protein
MRAELLALLSYSNIAIVQSELHHGSADNVARSEQINVLVDFIKFEELDAVTNLVLGGKRHDLTEVRRRPLARDLCSPRLQPVKMAAVFADPS